MNKFTTFENLMNANPRGDLLNEAYNKARETLEDYEAGIDLNHGPNAVWFELNGQVSRIWEDEDFEGATEEYVADFVSDQIEDYVEFIIDYTENS